ncbi:MFS general substrate transporter [Gonapodya prolifera JEL478]|uniref:MFS general substrate transporter n=1 Tax=Gonapodya prolifera (strain JEL478) TaxID=1344416 RepID=A0A139AAG5_GONPJ|nr:MFS general substrate transporter [Gonapodya prolifera JEL478]|eukprot:KXS13363.1 MFS general substrate transporter [Gonapodya prolifera JEL478]
MSGSSQLPLGDSNDNERSKLQVFEPPDDTDIEAQKAPNRTEIDDSARPKDEEDVAETKPGRDGDGSARADFVLADQTNHLPLKQLLIVFTGCGLAIMLSFLDQTIVATALPRISADFSAVDQSSWVGTSYLLTSTAFQTLWGRFSDIWGRKVCLLISLLIFLVGNALCGIAQSILQLIVFRALAGVGGGGITTLVMVVVSDVVSIRERGKYQGVIGAAIALAGVIGPLLGGVFSDSSGLGWRWCFYLNIPFGAAALLMIFFFLPFKKITGSLKAKALQIDYLGAILTISSTLLLLLATSWGGTTYPWKSPQIISLFLSSLLLIGATIATEVWVERRKRLPIIPMRLFLMRTPCIIFITQFLNGIPFYGQLYYIPQYFQVVKQESGTQSGIQLFPLLVAQTAGAGISAMIVSWTGRFNKHCIVVGYVLWTVACGLQYMLSRDTPSWTVVLILIFTGEKARDFEGDSGSQRNVVVCFQLGLGAGLTFQTSLVIAQAAVAKQDMAVVTGLRNFVRTIGGTLGLAICGAILNNSLISKLSAAPLSLPPNLVDRIIGSATDIPAIVAADQLGTVLDTYQEAIREVYLMFIPCMGVSAVLAAVFLEDTYV